MDWPTAGMGVLMIGAAFVLLVLILIAVDGVSHRLNAVIEGQAYIIGRLNEWNESEKAKTETVRRLIEENMGAAGHDREPT